MKYVDEYRDEALARSLAEQIRRKTTRSWRLMEVCGGQTRTIMRYGLDEMLPIKIRLVHGPGCPVCVSPVEIIDRAIQIASRPEVTLVSYGDMLRVPGSTQNLLQVKAAGADVRIVYSPTDSVKLAQTLPDRQVVFFGIGFETTAPANAMAVWQAYRDGLENFTMLVSHMLVPPAIRTILASPENRVQGLIAPGHVCAVAGYREYEEISREFHIPIVVGGFEPLDLLEAIDMLVKQLEGRRAEVQNQYSRAVTRDGNPAAQEMMAKVFAVCDRNWRGIGVIPSSGLCLRPEFAAFDAERVFETSSAPPLEEPRGCIGRDVLQGNKRPTECPAFGNACTPEEPRGALMVSGEGACAAYYRYRRHSIQ